MKLALRSALPLLLFASLASGQTRLYQQGTVVKMRMAPCIAPPSLMANLAGLPPALNEDCPEYTLVSPRVVYVVVSRKSGYLIPLAETVFFRLHKNELLVRVDDDDRETKLVVKEMSLRSEWEGTQPDRPVAAAMPRQR